MDTDSWPLSSEEIAALKISVGQRLSMIKAVAHYARNVEEVLSPTFTHKCTCPNIEHKQGNEKTPSFFFSEKDKTFMCFGCQIRGDIFDFLGKMMKRPSELILREYAKKNNISTDIIDFSGPIQRFDFVELKHNLCIQIRDHLVSKKDDPAYAYECDWADAMFRRIDDRFEKFTDADYLQAKYFVMQVGIEVERRKDA